jgi:hypothetical protein
MDHLGLLQHIGYWYQPLGEVEGVDPRLLVDPSWAGGDLRRVIGYLKAGHVLFSSMGFSWCRFRCGIRDRKLGYHDLTDGVWVWPEGLAHYVKRHAIALPDEFLSHLKANSFRVPELSEKEISARIFDRPAGDTSLPFSEDLWRDWARTRSAIVPPGTA